MSSSIMVDYQYAAEYAKSGRAGCKKCKTPIEKDSLRLAVRVQSPFFDGKVENWHHYDCFFKRFRPKNVGEIKNFEHLRFEDQKRIEKSMTNPETTDNASDSKNAGKTSKTNKKRKASAQESVSEEAKEFTVELAPSNRSTCKLCENKISKEEIRIGKLDHDSVEAQRFGPFNRWYHMNCFITARSELGFQWDASVMNGFEKLPKNEQKTLKKKLPADSGAGQSSSSKQPKLETKQEEEEKVTNGQNGTTSSSSNDKALKKQSDVLFKYVDELKKLKKSEIMSIFESNDLMKSLPKNNQRMVEFLADALAFGLPEKCPLCSGCLNFRVSQYVCYGNQDGWSRCTFVTENPKRFALEIPKDLKKLPFLSKYKFKPKQRIIDEKLKESFQNTVLKQHLEQMNDMVKKEEDNTDVTDNGQLESNKPLSGYKISYLNGKADKIKIESLGGKYCKDIDHSVLCIISDEDFETKKSKKGKKLKQIEDLQIPVVSEGFLTLLQTQTTLVKAFNDSKIEFWDLNQQDIEERINNLNVKNKIKSTFRSGYSSSSSSQGSGKSKSAKIIVKDGLVVDPSSELQDKAHIYRNGKDVYSAVLNLVDIASNKNSFYKLQLLEHDKMNGKYWLFKSWGRIGTDVGGCTTESFHSKQNAIEAFERVYFERTKNEWKHRDHFVKHPFSYYPVEVDYSECCDTKIDVQQSKSLLPEPVKNLIALLFDIQTMKRTMMEFELDLEKMPLGKISKNKILEACSTLKEINNLLNVEPLNMAQITAACTKFYSLVPHNFGLARPPLILSQDMVAKKNEMLESLLEIELAYDIIRNKQDDNNKEDVIDFNYKKLKADIEPLDRDDEYFKLIKKYVKNTHAETHDAYTLEIVNVFKVIRHGERDRFAEFVNDHNRMLLWHGSRLTNFVGIISEGLRIAPPEAPPTGYMFGKGIYFADSVSKSANYCYTNLDSNIGLLALSEVALGKCWELTEAKNVTKLKKQYQSVKGIGSSCPDPNDIVTMSDGVKVPLGKLIKNTDVKNTSLLYNEYIVYNVKQVNIRYLVQVKFNYKQLF